MKRDDSHFDEGDTRPVRVVHLTSVHPWDDPRIFHKMCRWLVRTGAEVHLVAANGLAVQSREVDGVRLHLLPRPEGRRERMVRTRVAVWRKALSLEPDLVHFHDPELLWGQLWREHPDVRVVYDVHEDLSEQVALKEWLPMAVRMMGGMVGKLERRLATAAHGIITVDPVILERFQNQDGLLVRNFPDVEALEKIKPADRPSNSRNKWLAICPGALGNDRGTGELVRAMEHLPDDFELWLVGHANDAEVAEWEKFPGWKRVRLFPRMPHAEVVAMVRSADAVLHVVPPRAQYEWARYPVKGLEAMACGVPLVMSDFENLRQTFGGAAVFVDPESLRDVAGAMRDLAANPERAVDLARTGRQQVNDEFSWRGEFRELLAEYSRLSPACKKQFQSWDD